ncbi:Hint domain-containing protein [Sagittula sp. MA-2]|jgi:hypothetical protein|uniref:Hint domain-containing protein n=1 Tax=Sagittula sp. MA-2 TaxID=3048007 RepID=UPI0024C3CF07|nr:Hint domain-containing protein [Sagittula sp. MA-2]WHZ34660.1 Hint domain-containing protein [Sagittula sp. MA-2]
MGASNTPLYDLIELSGIGAFTTYTTAPGGGGDIIGFVDNATYSDQESSNTATEINEINETADADNGILVIDGVSYNIQIYTPTNTSNPVTVTYDGGSTVDLVGDDFSSQVSWIVASPIGGGSDRYFMAIDDGVGDLPDITSIQTRAIDFNPSGDDVKINLDQDNLVTACFTTGTRIATPYGSRAVETLKPGDIVWTLDAGPQPLIWVGARGHGPRTLQLNPHLKPIRIPPGVLGAQKEVLVSPQHCLLWPAPSAAEQRLVRARHLAEAEGPVKAAAGTRHVRYHHLMLAKHHLLVAEGVLSESFYPGPIGIAGLGQPERLSLLTLLPALADRTALVAYGPTARPVLKRKEALALPKLRRTVSNPGE